MSAVCVSAVSCAWCVCRCVSVLACVLPSIEILEYTLAVTHAVTTMTKFCIEKASPPQDTSPRGTPSPRGGRQQRTVTNSLRALHTLHALRGTR